MARGPHHDGERIQQNGDVLHQVTTGFRAGPRAPPAFRNLVAHSTLRQVGKKRAGQSAEGKLRGACCPTMLHRAGLGLVIGRPVRYLAWVLRWAQQVLRITHGRQPVPRLPLLVPGLPVDLVAGTDRCYYLSTDAPLRMLEYVCST